MEQKIVKKSRHWPLLFATSASLLALGYLIISYPPTFSFPIGPLAIPLLPVTFVLFFIVLYSLSAFLFSSALQGLLVGMLFVFYFVFRLLGLTHPLFPFLLVCLFCSLEFVIYSKNR